MKKKEASILQDKIIKLMPILKDGGRHHEKDHDGYFMYSDTIVRYVVPISRSKGRLEDPLTKAERDFLQSADGLDEDLSIHRKKDNYWRKFEIVIRKDDKLMSNGFELDLSDPVDYIRYKVLLIQPDVAPNWESRFDRGEYNFALVDTNQVIDSTAADIDMKKDAYIYMSSIESSRKKMSDFLRVFGRRTSGSESTEYLKTEINKIIENKTLLNRMTTLINDDDFEMRLFIEDAVDVGAIVYSSNKYSLPGGDLINPNKPNLEGTVSKMNQLKKSTDDIYLTISTQIKESK